MNIFKMRRTVSGGNQFKSIVDDYILPFVVGFVCVSTVLWIRDYVNRGVYEVKPDPVGDTGSIPTFLGKNGQLYLKRHGVQEKEEDIFRIKADRLQFSIRAKASEQFKTEYVRQIDPGNGSFTVKTKPDAEPPGSIWPWPRIEKEAPPWPFVWVVTPTYRNPYQYAHLTVLAQAIYPARKFVRWLVMEDTHPRFKKLDKHIKNLNEFLSQFKVNFTVIKSNPVLPGKRIFFRPQGVSARRTAISYIRENKLRGVVYFADDDNTYDSDIFRQMQATKTVSVWPTGAITEWIVSSPVVNERGEVVDFFDAFTANRKFPLDFASFAVNADLIHENPRANIPWIQSYEETYFLTLLHADKSELLPLAANATQILTWHTKTSRINRHLYFNEDESANRWPATVHNLMKKYDFLFEDPIDTISKNENKHAVNPNIWKRYKKFKNVNSRLRDTKKDRTLEYFNERVPLPQRTANDMK